LKMITREQIKLFLQNIASSHYNIHTFGWGDVPDLLARENVIYPYMMVTPVPSTFEDGYINYGYLVSIADRIREGNQNEVEVDSDTFNIMMQVITQIDNLLYNDVDLVKGQTITPFMEAHRHRVSGHFSELQIRVKYNYDACAIPSDEVPLPLPPPPSCAVANYRVEYENGTLIEVGTIPSGGSKTIEVPNPSICANATWELRDEDGNLLDSGSVASGGSVTIEAPNADLLIRNSLNQTLYNLSLLSGSNGTQTIGDSSIRLEDSVGTLIANSSVVAEGSATITAPDGVVSVRKSDGVEIYSVDVRSNGTASQNVSDSVIENSDASYTANVKATEGLILPDQTIEVNTVNEGSIPSVGTIEIDITDGTNPVTPNDVTIVGRKVTVEVPSGGGVYDLDLVDRFGNAFPTKQVTANATWDLRTLTPYDFADIFLSRITSPSAAIVQAITEYVADCVAGGIWEDLVDIRPMVTTDSTSFVLNLKYPFLNESGGLGQIVGSPTINSNGVTTNGSSNGIIFPFNQQEYGSALGFSIYSRTSGASANNASYDIGNELGSAITGISIKRSSNVTAGIHRNNVLFSTGTDANATGDGLYEMVLDGSDYKITKNGLNLTLTNTPANYLTGIVRCPAYGVGARYSAGTGALNFTSQLGSGRNFCFAAVYKIWTPAKSLIHYNAVQKMQTTLGRNV